ncbi:response regulator transcription factor [Dyadobacter sp. CY345]|uniref:response regulator n=1 Tax=Dyadobacter sp. CY345 TaxID=2909335 RepID=UPI001F2739FB|nr:response regulator transcription factor [Dyadobacter sp. CY345]MCF2444051.1 response regulator transcription factor [Dyadobacter sp. CY345]
MKNPNFNVAIVDDNVMIRYATRYMLANNKINIAFEAENGQDCIDKMYQSEQIPDVIVLDMEMPVMSGFQAAVILKQNWPSTKIIAFSGRDDSVTINNIMAAGADYFLSKQSEPATFIGLIRTASGAGRE